MGGPVRRGRPVVVRRQCALSIETVPVSPAIAIATLSTRNKQLWDVDICCSIVYISEEDALGCYAGVVSCIAQLGGFNKHLC